MRMLRRQRNFKILATNRRPFFAEIPIACGDDLEHVHNSFTTCPSYKFLRYRAFNMRSILSSLLAFLSLTVFVSAQFHFFEQMFGGGQQQQQQQPQNVGSDSGWYRKHYESGKCRNVQEL